MAVHKKRKLRKKRLLPSLLISFGCLIVFATLAIFFVPPLFASVQTDTSTQILQEVKVEYPSSIRVGSVITDLPVIPVEVKNDNWPLRDDAALYMINSGKLGQSGNMVIYGHNTDRVFGHLAKVELGDMITINTNFNNSVVYKVDAIRVVSSNDVSILKQNENERITLYTCNDFWGTKKLVITGNLVSK